MSLRSARTIAELSEVTTTYDAVIGFDGALCQALNHRLREPRLGRFAATPRTLVSNKYNPTEHRSVFHQLITEEICSWQEAAHVSRLILDCWDQTGDPHQVLDYEQFDNSLFQSAVPIVTEAASVRKRLSDTPVLAEDDVAVIGHEFLNPLDRQQVPADSDVLPVFRNNDMVLPTVSVLPSPNAIVETLVSNVQPETANQVAVVIDSGGPLATLVEAAFAAENIPLSGGPGFIDDPAVRTFLAIARGAQQYEHARLKDFASILAACNIDRSVADLEKRLVALDDPVLTDLTELLATVEEQTFGELVGVVEEMCAVSLRSLYEELSVLGLLNQRVEPERVDDLEFYLSSFNVPVERNTQGVKLVDATTATYVDRPVVYYLGLDTNWIRSIPDRPWIDHMDRDRDNLTQFEILLQNGTERHYLVTASTDGTSLPPCPYFHEFTEIPLNAFTDFPHLTYTAPRTDAENGFAYIPVEASINSPTSLSKTDLNMLANSPLDYCFDQLVVSPEQIYFKRGTLLHDYAEFYVNHPRFAERLDRQELVDLIQKELDPFLDDHETALIETEIRLGIEIIESFLTVTSPESQRYDGYRDTFWPNYFADYFNRPVTSPVTEQYFQNRTIGVSGVIDLISSPTELIDFKTGRKQSVESVIKKARVDPIHDEPDFQAIMYLAHHRTVIPDARIDFVFFHIFDLLADAMRGQPDIAKGEIRLHYIPESFETHLASEEAFQWMIDNGVGSSDRSKTLERLGFETYHGFLSNTSLPEFSTEEDVLHSSFANEFTALLQDTLGEDTCSENECKNILRTMCQLRRQFVFAADVDAVEEYVELSLATLDNYHQTQFPRGDPNPDRLSHPDMVSLDE